MIETDHASLVEAATLYAQFGWFVFPCKRDKTPRTENGFHDATLDPQQIMEWWHRWPDTAIGVACGASGILVLDYDPRHDEQRQGSVRLAELLGETATRSAQTGSGGRHFYFRVPDGAEFRNSAGILGPGIDVRATGGYVIAPPSQNDSGSYLWLNREPCRPIPTALAQALTTRPPSPPISSVQAGGSIPAGGRNAALTAMAGAMRRKSMSPLAIEQALLAENQAKCDPPLSTEEVRAIARSIGRYTPSDPPTFTEPTAELVSQDAVRVVVPSPDGVPLAFTFSEMAKGRHALSAHLSLAFLGTRDPFTQRVDIESSSQRTNLRRELDSLYGSEHKWGLAINTAYSLAAKTFLGQDRSLGLRDIPAFIGARYLFNPLMPAEGATILFGDGSTGKSYVALSLAVASVSQTTAWQQYTCPQANVLYIDYEDSEVNWRRRVGRILAGMGLPESAVAGLRYWKARGVPVRDATDAIKRAAAENGVGWLIVDSAAPACGGKPEDADTVLGYYAALAEIGLPCLTIAHVPKNGNGTSPDKAFGSIFWHNGARRTWRVERTQEIEADDIRVSLTCCKVNDGRKPASLGLEISFDGEDGPVEIAPFDLRQDPGLINALPNQARINAALTEPMTISDIAAASGLAEPIIRTTLNRYSDAYVRVAEVGVDAKGRRPVIWARRATHEEEPF